MKNRKLIIIGILLILVTLISVTYFSYAYQQFDHQQILSGESLLKSEYRIHVVGDNNQEYSLTYDEILSACSKNGTITIDGNNIKLNARYQETCDIYIDTKYAISYELFGGHFVNGYTPVTRYSSGDIVNLPTSNNLQCAGSNTSFYGWYDNPNFEGAIKTTVDTNNEGNKIYYAKCGNTVTRTGTITYEMIDGGVVSSNTQTYTQLPFTLLIPTKIGYHFNGWIEYFGSEITGGIQTFDLTNTFINPNSTYPMNWDGTQWVSSNNGVNSSKSCMVSNEFTIGSSDGTLMFDWHSYAENNYDYLIMDAINTATGVSVKGTTNATSYFTTSSWSASNYSKFSKYTRGKSSTSYSSESLTLPANASYKVYFCFGKDSSGHNNDDKGYVKNIKATYDTTINNIEVGDIIYGNILLPTVEGNISLTDYGRWEPNTYTVEFYDYSGSTKLGIQKFTYNESKALSTAYKGSVPVSGESFYGWATSPNSTSRVYTDGQSVSNLSSLDGGVVKLYAIWQKTNYGYFYSTSSSTQSSVSCSMYNSQSSCRITTPTPKSYSGYTALGWRTDKTATTASVNSNASVTISSDVYYYAVYSKNVTLSYDANGGSTTPSSASKTVYYNGAGKASGSGNYSNASFTLAAGPSKTDFTFYKWAMGSTSGTLYDAGASITLTDNTTMYARYTGQTYTITYVLNGGAQATSGVPTSYVTGLGAIINGKPTHPTHTFDGWCSDVELTNCSTTITIDYNETGNKTYYAKFIINYTGYYADANDDGTIDGVIFFDYTQGADTASGFLGPGVAVAAKTAGLKSYTTKTVDGHENVVVPVAGTTGDDRFYVIETANTKPASGDTNAYWYYSLYQHADTSKTSTAFGSGKTNTATMKALWNTGYDGQYAQNTRDIWSINMGDKFVLSNDEWRVLGSNLMKKATEGTYSSVTFSSGASISFSNTYWSSSLGNGSTAGGARFVVGDMTYGSINSSCYVRLALTF